MFVGVVIVTYRRPDTVCETVQAVLRQTRAPDLVTVVDNCADPVTAGRLRALAPDLTYIAMTSNDGFAAGLARGISESISKQVDAIWLLDDDSPPSPDDLESALLTAATAGTDLFMVGTRGGTLVAGVIRHDVEYVTATREADFLLVDGALLSAAAVQRSGLPRPDFFMMHEDLEYSTRIRRCGGRLLVRPSRPTAMHLGSEAPWRSYYQARNHLRIAIERRSATWLFGWFWRMCGLCLADIVRGRWDRLGLRLQGALDGLRGRMGRTIDPADYH